MTETSNVLSSAALSRPRSRLHAVYQHLHVLDAQSRPLDPFPTVVFATEAEVLPYTFTPAVHCIEATDEETYIDIAVLLDEIETDAGLTSYPGDPIRVTHHDWQPELATTLTIQLLDTLYECAVADLAHVELQFNTARDPIPWDAFTGTTNSRRGN